ncbi:MAG: hypothetical protein ACOYKC_09950 [Anaerolineaceae bacterium]|jgi:hypothetical protein
MMKSVNDLFLINCIEYLKVFPTEMDPLPEVLENRLSQGITKISDCFLLQQHVWKAPHVLEEVEKLSSPEDKIFFELDHNELCMLDYLLPHKSNNSKKEASKALSYGVITSYRLARMLKPFGIFRIIHSFGYDLEDKLISSYISFYRVRADQPDWVNNHRDEINGLMVITTESGY